MGARSPPYRPDNDGAVVISRMASILARLDRIERRLRFDRNGAALLQYASG
jgi:hypothetical protein